VDDGSDNAATEYATTHFKVSPTGLIFWQNADDDEWSYGCISDECSDIDTVIASRCPSLTHNCGSYWAANLGAYTSSMDLCETSADCSDDELCL